MEKVEYRYEDLLDKSLFYTTDEVRKLCGRDVPHNLYIKDKNKWLEYNDVALNAISVVSQSDEKIKISVSKKLLENILKDKSLLTYTEVTSMATYLNSYDDVIDTAIGFYMSYVDEFGNISTPLIIKRTDLVNLLSKCVKDNSKEYTKEDIFHLNVLTLSVNAKQCRDIYADSLHSTFIDGVEYVIPVSSLLMLLHESDDVFNKFIDGAKKYEYQIVDEDEIKNGDDNKIVMFLLKDFIDRNRLLDRFIFEEKILKRYKKIKDQNYLDFQTIDKYNRSFDESFRNQIRIDNNLKDEVMRYMDNTYSPLEKAIHIYIRLCQIFKLDEEVFAGKREELYNFDNISKKNNINNIITTNEFIMIYSKFLNELGIKYSNLSINNPDNVVLYFKSGEYDIELSNTNYITSDLSNIKIDESIVNMKSINKNRITKKKFNETLNKVKDNIIINRKRKHEFDYCLEQYRNKYLNEEIISENDMYAAFMKSIRRSDLEGMDAIAYLNKVFENTLGLNKNVCLEFLSKKKSDFSFIPVGLLIIKSGDEFKYVLIDYHDKDLFRIIDKEYLEKILNTKEYLFIGKKKRDLTAYGLTPGKEVSKYVR